MKKLSAIMIVMVFAVVGFSFYASADFYVISSQNKCGPCKGTRSAGGRWCDNQDGTITDMTTCLLWLKYADWGGAKPWRNPTSSGETQYDDAHVKVSELDHGTLLHDLGGGFWYVLLDGSVEGDWRLPSKAELVGITEGGESVSASNMQLFYEVQGGLPYWTSTTVGGSIGYAYTVDMEPMNVYTTAKWLDCYMWPVRNPK